MISTRILWILQIVLLLHLEILFTSKHACRYRISFWISEELRIISWARQAAENCRSFNSCSSCCRCRSWGRFSNHFHTWALMQNFTTILLTEAHRFINSILWVLCKHSWEKVRVVILTQTWSRDCTRMILNNFLVFVLEELSTTLQHPTSTADKISTLLFVWDAVKRSVSGTSSFIDRWAYANLLRSCKERTIDSRLPRRQSFIRMAILEAFDILPRNTLIALY